MQSSEQGFHIYGMSGAGSLIVEFILTIAGQDYTISFPDYDARQDPEFKSFSPRGQIPILVTPEGHHIGESLAITYYLLNRFPDCGLIDPADHPNHGLVLQWLSYLATTLYNANQRYYQTKSFDGNQEAIRESGFNDRRHCYDLIEARTGDWLAGGHISAADLYLYMLLRWDRNMDQELATRPRLKRIFDQVAAVPAIKSVIDRQPKKILNSKNLARVNP